MSIGIGINAWVWQSPFTRESARLIEHAAKMGFDAFTVPVESPELIDVDAIRAVQADFPLRLYVSGAFSHDRDLTHADASVRQNALNYIRRTLAICEQLGVGHLVGPAYSATGKRRKIPQQQRAREWELAVAGLSQAGRMAADHGVVLGIEPLNRFETDLINTSTQVKQLISDIDLPSVRIHLDTFHMHIEERSVYDAIRVAGKDLVYVDASESDRGTPGKGQVHWHEVVRALRDIDYQGDCIIESFTPECESIADAAAIWRPLASSQDALAKGGIEFLQQLLSEPMIRDTPDHQL
ncbi:sugar phosphate isomerase/epimerase family protein [Parahaliea aestuarii]|uniref:Sugar phosphate isomerase/epimerase n=1 Tax=Parahaliea aestuarii TaxID=1852021 RepID=A0A5C8ZX67_9GAMM|nr:sugar phosphate isomerase/epimerase family protein [Parahaliea aestuarii]TXS93115.1 sugar phosphate isomerase/epimerase [Parahaliea aestuarii]